MIDLHMHVIPNVDDGSRSLAMSEEDAIKSSGYVVDSLEAAIWSLITTASLEEGILKAVNLGNDADTVGAIAGGLAGLYYGYRSIPWSWRKVIAKRAEIVEICGKMLVGYGF